MAAEPDVKFSLKAIASPANTWKVAAVSVSDAVFATEFSECVPDSVELPLTVTALVSAALVQVLVRARVAVLRELVSVQTIAPGVAPTVSTLPTRVVPPVRPVQARDAL